MNLRPRVFVISLVVLFVLGTSAPGGADSPSSAKKYALVIGCGDEPEGKDKTIFDRPFEEMSPVLKKAGYNVELAFDGGHKNVEKMSNEHFPGKRKDLSASNVQSLLTKFREDIRAGRIKSGDQLLFVNMNHGYVPKSPAKTHHVAAPGGSFNMDEVAGLRDEAEKAGVRFAVIDQSCYSGSSVSLGTPKTCAMSITGANTVGYNSEMRVFWQKAESGRSLEKSFLKMRSEREMPVAPAISSEAGKRAAETLHAVQQHLLNYGSDIRRQVNEVKDCVSCFNQSVLSVPLGIDMDALLKAGASKRQLRKLEQRASEHARIYKEIAKAILLEQKLAARREKIGDQIWSWETMARFDLARSQKVYGELFANEKDERGRANLQVTIRHLPIVEERRKALESDPDYKAYLGMRAKIESLEKDILGAAQEVVKSENDLYESIYDSLRNEEPNPCAKFEL